MVKVKELKMTKGAKKPEERGATQDDGSKRKGVKGGDR